jgi:adenylyl-sulfate kinase
MSKALTFWFTGLSGSGKTTIANSVRDYYQANGKQIKILDGDDVREKLNRHLAFTRVDIEENNRIIAELCMENIESYDYIFVPVISPFEYSRKLAREMIGPRFNLVYVKAALAEVINRDVKGLYKKALKGELKNFIGLEVPYEVPKLYDLVLDTEKESIEESVKKLVSFIQQSSQKESNKVNGS